MFGTAIFSGGGTVTERVGSARSTDQVAAIDRNGRIMAPHAANRKSRFSSALQVLPVVERFRDHSRFLTAADQRRGRRFACNVIMGQEVPAHMAGFDISFLHGPRRPANG